MSVLITVYNIIVVHNTALNSSDKLLSICQTIVTAQMTSIGGEGNTG